MSFIKSLRVKLLLAALVPGTLVLAVVAIIAMFANEREASSVVLQRDTELAKISASRLSEGLERHRGVLVDLAGEPEVEAMEVATLNSAFERAQVGLFLFDGGVVVYDREGRAVWSDPFSFERRNRAFPAPSEFEKIRASNGSHFSDVFNDAVSSEAAILLGVPIVASGGEFMGVLAGISTLESLRRDPTYASVLEIEAGREGFAYLVDGSGRVIHHPDSGQLARNLSHLAPVEGVAGGETGAVITESPDGRDVVSGFAPVPNTRWGIVTQESWESVVGPIRGYSRLLLGLLALGGVLAGGLVLLTIGRILKPMRDLTAGARRIAGGDFDQPIAADTDDEVQALAEQFNTMATALKESYAGLEQRVAERTEEVRVSEERYRTLFEQSIEAIFMTSADGKVVDANQATVDLFGFTREELIGRDYADRFVDAGDRDRMREAMAVGGGTVKDFELRLQKRDGTVMDCVLTVRRRGASERTPAGLEGTVRDVTAAKRTEEELFAQTRETAVLDERNRMAREIHDTLAQGFTGIVLQLEAGEQALGGDREAAAVHIDRAKSLARESLQEARRSVWDLVPEILEARSLEDALKEEVQRFATRGIEKAAFTHTGKAKDVPRDVQAALLRICQEALMNTRKHAHASRVEVRLKVGPDAVSLIVEDDGVGFDPDGASSDGQEGGYGMTSMVQRARLQGGTLTIGSSRHKGTVIEAKIPTAGPRQPA